MSKFLQTAKKGIMYIPRRIYRIWFKNRIKGLVLSGRMKEALSLMWKKAKGYELDWNNPQDLNEKITWLMGMTDTSDWTRLADKVQVREYLKEKGLELYAPKLYATWTNPDDIELETLPKKFVLKCNHDCGSVKIIDKDKPFDWNEIKEFLRIHVNKPYGIETVEPHYIRIPRCILAEEYIENDNSDFSSSMVDYKFWCFDGKPYYCLVLFDRGEHIGKMLYDSVTWKPMVDFLAYDTLHGKVVPRPKNLELMNEIATKLSAGFPEVRVDLYEACGRVYFGEMTFTGAGGRNMNYLTKEALLEMGRFVTLPNV